MRTLKQKTISGVVWNTAGRVSNQILQFVLAIILMRLLQPNDFGLLAMAMVLIGFANIFSEFGFSSALVQNQNINERHKSSIFWLNIIVGILLTFLFFFLAKLISSFYENSELVNVIKILSFSFIVSSFSIVPSTLLQKEMNYAAINKIDVSVVLFSGIISVYMAYTGWGVYSLVFQYLTSLLFKVPFVFYASHWHPKFLFSKSSVKELFSYSAYLAGFKFINYWARKSDDLLIGKFMGADTLGIYSRAYNLMLLPITHIISLVSNVMFPALSSIQEDKLRVKRIYLNVIQILAFFTFPLMIGLTAVADNFVLGIFGNKWIEVIPLLQILSFVGVTQTLLNPTGWLYTSQGKTKWMFWWGIFGGGSIIIAIVIGVLLGSVYYVALAYLVINLILTYPGIMIPGRFLNLSFSEVFNKVIVIFIISVIMSIIVYLMGLYLLNNFSAQTKLIIQVLSGISIYLITVISFKVEAYTNFVNLILEQIKFYKKQNNQ